VVKIVLLHDTRVPIHFVSPRGRFGFVQLIIAAKP